VLLLLGLVIRLVLVIVPGHNGDTSIMVGWAEYLATNGGADFYRDAGSIYPALLYVLWPLGIWLDDPQLGLVLKALSIPFDMALATLLALITARLVSTRAAYGAAALYLFNPAVLLAGPIWGQVDAAGTLFFVAALVAISRERYATAGALAVVAGLFKPQFGLVLQPVLAVAVYRAVRERRPMPTLRTVLAGAAAYAALAWPIGLDPLRYAEELRRITANQPMTSLLAFNPWGLLIGFDKPDDGYVVVGGIVLVLGLAASLVPLLRRRDLPALLAVGACLAFAVYFLPTRAHDRYLFPAVAVLAPLAVVNGRRLVAYLVLSVAFALALVYALATITPFPLPEPIREVMVTAPSVWAIGIVLMASAVVWVSLFTRGNGGRIFGPQQHPGQARGEDDMDGNDGPAEDVEHAGRGDEAHDHGRERDAGYGSADDAAPQRPVAQVAQEPGDDAQGQQDRTKLAEEGASQVIGRAAEDGEDHVRQEQAAEPERERVRRRQDHERAVHAGSQSGEFEFVNAGSCLSAIPVLLSDWPARLRAVASRNPAQQRQTKRVPVPLESLTRNPVTERRE